MDRPRQETRKTRLVCLSDTHNRRPPLPAGDVLIHCGDLTLSGQLKEIRQQIAWLAAQPHEIKILVAGERDLTLDGAFCRERERDGEHRLGRFRDWRACHDAVAEQAGSLTYLEHEARDVRLLSPDGPRTRFRVFGSPYTHEGRGGRGELGPLDNDKNSSNNANDDDEGPAFAYTRAELDDGAAAEALWERIPLDADVVVTHGPAYGHRDEARGRPQGCEVLRRALWRVRPRLALCGHVHEARGAERVRWDLGSSNVRYKEAGVAQWRDPAPPRRGGVCLLDLTDEGEGEGEAEWEETYPGWAGVANLDGAASSRLESWDREDTAASPGLGTRGLGAWGGDPESTARCDRPALVGRLDRKETVVVNCATTKHTAAAAPHRLPHKPIVIDLDLPVWE